MYWSIGSAAVAVAVVSPPPPPQAAIKTAAPAAETSLASLAMAGLLMKP
jgi:hypothetical protein